MSCQETIIHTSASIAIHSSESLWCECKLWSILWCSWDGIQQWSDWACDWKI